MARQIQLFKSVFFTLAILFLCGCREDKQSNQCKTEENNVAIQDTTLAIDALKYRSELINKFNDTIQNHVDSDFYYLIQYSSFDYGTSVKFERKGGKYFLLVKTLNPKDSATRLTQYLTEIDSVEWDRLEYMVDEFDFWKAKKFKNNKALDGYVCFLEGNRLTKSGKLHQVIGRGSPRYDKMGALCNYIIDYEESLVFQYKQVHK
jgi:hypothetical protein